MYNGRLTFQNMFFEDWRAFIINNAPRTPVGILNNLVIDCSIIVQPNQLTVVNLKVLQEFINPFSLQSSISVTPAKTLENLWFFWNFRGYKNGTLALKPMVLKKVLIPLEFMLIKKCWLLCSHRNFSNVGICLNYH